MKGRVYIYDKATGKVVPKPAPEPIVAYTAENVLNMFHDFIGLDIYTCPKCGSTHTGVNPSYLCAACHFQS